VNALRARWRSACAAAGIAGVLTACEGPGAGEVLARCPTDTTPIAAVQGAGFTSPLAGRTVTVTGVISLVSDDGLYIESLAPDSDPRTAEGLFLAAGPARAESATALQPGQRVKARGRVAERGEHRDTQTALVALASLQACGDPAPRPVTAVDLPLGDRDREALESMRVRIDSASVVTDVYHLHRGEFRIAKDLPLPQPTEVTRPGPDARARAARNRDHSLYVRLAPGERVPFAVGDELLSDAGVLGHDGEGPRLLLEESARLLRQPLPALAAPADGVLRIASLNLQNYFNGDGQGGGFPAPRGAETDAEFTAQRERLAGAVAHLAPHVLAVMELENDGFGPQSAAADLLEDLERATGERWAVADPGAPRVGSDEIAVGLFYRPGKVEALGPARLLDAAPFDLLSRTPLAQVLRDRASGETLLVNVNHLKSKGSCPDQGRDRDQGDGQGCWNRARLEAARALAPWVKELAEREAGGRALVLGDLNAYRMEDPVQHLLIEGFADLTATMGERHHFSYVYFGQSGTLDHALATPALLRGVAGAGILNVNAGWPRRMPLEPAWLGVSDHDPVVLDLRLTQASTSD